MSLVENAIRATKISLNLQVSGRCVNCKALNLLASGDLLLATLKSRWISLGLLIKAPY